MAKILFVHQNSPAQFRFLIEAMVSRGHDVRVIGGPSAVESKGAKLSRWKLKRGSTPAIFKDATRAEADILRATAASDIAAQLAASGYVPDLIIGHPGWGETLFLGATWPDAKKILYAEFYYSSSHIVTGFDKEFGEATLIEHRHVTAKGATLSLAYTQADYLVTPTSFQGSSLPDLFQSRLSVIHEGVDTQRIRPRLDAVVKINGRTFSKDRPVVTFANRIIEPLRGSHSFFRAIPKILAESPDAEIVIIGAAEGSGYGAAPPAGQTWKDVFWAEIEADIDQSRVHFVGKLPNDQLNALMSIAAAHVYLTYPFVLSWSLLEAMASGAYIVASDTAPVREVIEDGRNGVLVDFFSPPAIADAVLAGIRSPDRFDALRQAARDDILARYDHKTVCLPQWLALIDQALA